MRVKQKIEIGAESFLIEVEQTNDGSEAYIDVDEVTNAQRKLAIQLLKNRKTVDMVTPELINFFLEEKQLQQEGLFHIE